MASIKLSVTHRAALKVKYGAAALEKIDGALRDWIAADGLRGIQTVHVALDDQAAMGALGVPAVSRRLTALRAKRAIDALARRLAPDYIVIVGGSDVVPQFHVVNPSFDPKGDDDHDVPTDNPYACSRPYRAGARDSYLVPDRVVGRIPDVPCEPGAGDPAWLVTSLRHAGRWKPRARSFYDDAYAVCCDAWRKAGLATMKYLGLPADDLLISPPHIDKGVAVRRRLARTLHVTKCHGAEMDARFFGQKGKKFPTIVSSDTLRTQLKAGTLASAMCCYGAQVFAPYDPRNLTPGLWPIALAHLRRGAVGFMGATKIAWVGPEEMMCADWIVASYLKKCLDGASTGRALLEAKQDYVQVLYGLGQRLDSADEKTLIEFVLLGDPSVHPVRTAAAPAIVRAAAHTMPAAAAAARGAQTAQRAERRAARAALGTAVTKRLPRRSAAEAPDAAFARKCYQTAVAALHTKADLGKMNPAQASATRLRLPAAALPAAATVAGAVLAPAAAAAATATAASDAMEYGWSSRERVDGTTQVRLLKAQFDAAGNLLRSRLLHSA